MEQGMRKLRSVWCVAICCFAACWLCAQEKPEWEFEIAETEVVSFEGEQWHVKDYGWLFTCRMKTKSTNLIRPITHLEFRGLDADEAIVWTERKVVRRKDFDSALRGSETLFVRAILEDVPQSVVKMELHFDSGEDEAAPAE